MDSITGARPEGDGANDWWVYSTAVGDGLILVENRTTGQRAVVRDPTPEEWGEAFHAPSNPYRWPHPERLVIFAAEHVAAL